MKKIIFSLLFLSSLLVNAQSFNCGDTLTDVRDGKKYATVLIGSQCWMQDNLNFGTMINHTSAQADNLVDEKYCYNDDTANCSLYGALYQWNEMMNYSAMEGIQGICPNDWRLPADNEWKTLEIFLGMSPVAADSNNAFRGTDQAAQLVSGGSSGFNGQYAGALNGSTNVFDGQGNYTLFWTSTLYSVDRPLRRGLYDFETRVYRGSGNTSESPLYGYCVRCVTDITNSIDDFSIDEAIKIYPVPAREELFIAASDYKSDLVFEMMDMTGRVVKSGTCGPKINAVNVKDLPGGMYLVKVVSKEGSIVTMKKIQILD